MSVQPIQGFPMLVANIGADPDDDCCVEPASIREKLTQMAMVGAFQLVLDNYGTIGSDFASNDIA
jgi:hypothetical protein